MSGPGQASASSPITALEVTWADGRRELKPGDAFTFGRHEACDVCLAAEDRGISRRAGLLEESSGRWHLTNTSSKHALNLVDRTRIPRALMPGLSHVIGPGRLEVVIAGQVRRHCIVVAAPIPPPSDQRLPTGLETELGAVHYLDEDRRALVALFAGYLYDFPRYDPRPVTYAAAAARLGCRVAALRRRIDRLYARLDRAGVPGISGEHALERLAEHVLSTGVITPADLARLAPS